MNDRTDTRGGGAKPSFGKGIAAGWRPDIDTPEKARKATMLGVYAMVVMTVIVAPFIPVMPETFGDSDVIAFVIGELGGAAIVIAIALAFMFINAVRGTLAHRKPTTQQHTIN